MSYCPNCGVTLSHTESTCPLCRLPVRPVSDVRAYPLEKERVPQDFHRTALLSFLSVLPTIQLFFQGFVQFVTDIRR